MWKVWRHFFASSLSISIVLSLAFYITMAITLHKNNYEDSGLTFIESKTVFANPEGLDIHCIDMRNIEKCLTYLNNTSDKEHIIWLGNSQLHTINHSRFDNINSTEILHNMLDGSNKNIVTISLPNANLREHLFLLDRIIKRVNIKYLVVGLVFDDFRESGLRDTVSNPDSSHQTNFKERFETMILSHLDNVLNFGTIRAELVAQTQMTLYRLRNYIFGITYSSKRSKIEGAYQDNMSALRELLETSKAIDIRSLIYIAPIRQDLGIPYHQHEYNGFKEDLSSIARDYGVQYVDLDTLIENEFWGKGISNTFDPSEAIDYMHFTGMGHKLLAEKVYGLLTGSLFVR